VTSQSEEQELLIIRQEKLRALEVRDQIRSGLPHLYGMKWYTWAYDFFESTNHMNFLCAANQISKSTTQIRKCIHWGTAVELWPLLWPHKRPVQFWYLYPTKDVVNIEFETKWKPMLPQGEMQNHPVFGWKVQKKGDDIWAIHFNSGVHVYFKTYAQNVQHLQSGTCDAIFCDEELPTDLLDELLLRISASDGYFHMVFTATLGQDYWRRVIEPKSKDEEIYPDAFKRQVSMFDCLTYMDGSRSHWSNEKIQIILKRCRTKAQAQRRVFGKFAVDAGLKYEAFERDNNMKKRRPGAHIPKTWNIYGGVDIGSGGANGHPAAVCFVAVDPTYTQARVFRAWRGDGIPTTAGDVVKKYIELRGAMRVTSQYYDHSSPDFLSIATSNNVAFLPADKAHDKGEEIINTLFRNQMIYIYEDDPELEKLAGELMTLKGDTPKRMAADDLCDAFRYAVSQIPWDFSIITGETIELKDTDYRHVGMTPEQIVKAIEMSTRRGETTAEEIQFTVEDEMAEWNDLYG
jgi:hypothetical protein